MGTFRTRVIAVAAIAILGVGAPQPWSPGVTAIPAAEAQEDWKKEFEDVCSRTQDAMVIPSDDLRTLIGRCDRLKPIVDKLDESQRKVYSKRLQLCRDLYLFVLESREKNP